VAAIFGATYCGGAIVRIAGSGLNQTPPTSLELTRVGQMKLIKPRIFKFLIKINIYRKTFGLYPRIKEGTRTTW
jgi:hypothetical protein